jgi:hypothetical protein
VARRGFKSNGQRQCISESHPATTRAQLDDLLAVMTFDAIDRQTGQPRGFLKIDNAVELDPARRVF